MKEEKDFRAIADTLLETVKPDMTPKQLLNAAQKRHPKASKKDIVRAAFYFVISNAATHPQMADTLHGFAMSERTGASSTPG